MIMLIFLFTFAGRGGEKCGVDGVKNNLAAVAASEEKKPKLIMTLQ